MKRGSSKLIGSVDCSGIFFSTSNFTYEMLFLKVRTHCRGGDKIVLMVLMDVGHTQRYYRVGQGYVQRYHICAVAISPNACN